jgi:RNA polymerase sigma-32 factor
MIDDMSKNSPETGENEKQGFEEEIGEDEIVPSDAADLIGEEQPTEDKSLVPFDSLQHYLSEIRCYSLLSPEEEHRLAVEYKEFANIEAAYKLVTSNLRLVVWIAREYEKAFRNLLDLIQEGNVGLMEALKNFDPYRGVRFPSYAVWWIRAYIIRYIMNNWRMVKIGTTQAQRKLFFNLQKEKQKLEAEGFTPGPKLLAQRLDVKEKEIVEMDQRLSHSDFSTDVPLGDGNDKTLIDFLPHKGGTPEEHLANAEVQSILREKMEEFAKGLKDKELVVFRQRLLTEDPLTLREIGEKYRISRERVRQIEARVKKKLKDHLGKEFKDIIDITADPS